jgi:DNA-directed RNA polymerase specialized sigma24 family protein
MTDSKNTLIKSAVMATTAPAMLRTDDVDSKRLPVANDPFIAATVNAAAARSRRAAVTAGLTDEERDDLFQEIALDILERHAGFDPARGAAGTFTGVVSAHRTADFLSDRSRDKWRFIPTSTDDDDSLKVVSLYSGGQAAHVSLDAANDDLIENKVPGEAEQRPLWQEPEDHARVCAAASDLEAAFQSMSDEQRSLYELLCHHQDVPAAAKASGMSSATFYRRVADLEMHLRMFGFKTAA